MLRKQVNIVAEVRNKSDKDALESKKRMILRLAGTCGILAPIIAFTCIGLSILYSPWFSWTDNWLSDLGGIPGEKSIWASRGIVSILFNFGLIVAGILGICFVIGLRKSDMLDTQLGRVGTVFLFLGACALIGIGIFPETTGVLHTYFSIASFFMVSFSLLFIGPALIGSSEKALGWFTIILLVIALVSVPLFLIPKPWGSNAVAEMFPIAAISIFALIFGIKMLKLAFISLSREEVRQNFQS